LRVVEPPLYPNVITQSHWDHICVTDEGRLQYLPSAAAKPMVDGADRLLVAVLVKGQWVVQRGDERPFQGALPDRAARCAATTAGAQPQ
jgi:hypothetical protein